MGLLQTLVSTLRISAPTKVRSPKWDGVRTKHLKAHPKCAACGSVKTLEVHHIVPFSDNPALELDPKNLITLCESTSNGIICHLCVGHLGDYKSYNKDVILDAASWLTKFKGRPK
jgi:5-methylcytosine-specific restriction protein A